MNYETSELEPQAEIVILSAKPSYTIGKKNQIVKEAALDEMRFELSPAALNKVIGELQLAAQQLNTYSQAGAAFNTIIGGLNK